MDLTAQGVADRALARSGKAILLGRKKAEIDFRLF
jgi:hypothetical protein